jgi:hypothetical protein
VNNNRRRIAAWLILVFMAQGLMACDVLNATMPVTSPTPGVMIETPNPSNPAYALAQATIDSGQSQLSDLSQKATQVGLSISRAAKDAAQSTQDANQRQKADLNYQATIISLNIAQAVATQSFLSQQTSIANDATTAAQNSTATAAQSAYLASVNQTQASQASLDAQSLQTAQAAATLTAYPLMATREAYQVNITQTAQAQMVLNSQATQSALAIASLTAHPQTATPFAMTQAAILMQEYGREQQAFNDQVVAPLFPIIATIVLILLVVGIIFAYRRFMPVAWSRRWPGARVNLNPRPILVIDSVSSDHDLPQLKRIVPLELTPLNPPPPPGDHSVHVEIVNATEPPVVNWIEDVERQLANEGGQSL